MSRSMVVRRPRRPMLRLPKKRRETSRQIEDTIRAAIKRWQEGK